MVARRRCGKVRASGDLAEIDHGRAVGYQHADRRIQDVLPAISHLWSAIGLLWSRDGVGVEKYSACYRGIGTTCEHRFQVAFAELERRVTRINPIVVSTANRAGSCGSAAPSASAMSAHTAFRCVIHARERSRVSE